MSKVKLDRILTHALDQEGEVPKLWQNILETLDLELTAVPRAADNG